MLAHVPSNTSHFAKLTLFGRKHQSSWYFTAMHRTEIR